MMTPPVFALYITCVFLGTTAQTTNQEYSTSVHQQHRFMSVKSGENLTLQCFHDRATKAWLYWFKETLGQKPRLISTYFDYNTDVGLSHEFKRDQRFTLDADDDRNHLNITDLQISDSATYLCVRQYTYTVEFVEAITIIVKDSVAPVLLQQSCVYNLPLKELNVFHAGIYYCAVASCGHILFGNGTKLDFKDDLVYFLSGVSAFSSLLVVVLSFTICIMNKRNSCQSSESQATCSAPSSAKAKDLQDADRLYYAALSANLTKRPRRQKDQTWTECVYHNVQQQKIHHL